MCHLLAYRVNPLVDIRQSSYDVINLADDAVVLVNEAGDIENKLIRHFLRLVQKLPNAGNWRRQKSY